MKYLLYIPLMVFLFSCKGEKQLEITTTEIDSYVALKLNENQEYDVSQSLSFSRENETYDVVRYIQNDTVVLYMETSVTADEQIIRQTFYKSGLPIYVDEYIASNITEMPFTERKVYLNGASILEATERKSATEFDMEFMEFEASNVAFDTYDFNRPDRAMNQLEEYAMHFEEVLIIDPQKYLILENPESKYDVALFLTDDHPLITELSENPDKNKGREIFVTHQFILMGSIQRMLFIDGYFKDEATDVATSSNE